ncbi:MAG: hypothetical protein LBV27_09515 [Oscillospiraceae bacterium]|jgi:hypothetical protein|nr:hypothetical protein [Oscillospiraceae bacterium]
MTITRYSQFEDLNKAMEKDEPFLAVISFDGEQAYMGHIDECMEHHILLQKLGLPPTDIDKYFRIIFDREGADWTFICPPDYKGITDKTRRITAFYNDGFRVIAQFLSEIGYFCDIKIPKRYRRHFDVMGEGGK